MNYNLAHVPTLNAHLPSLYTLPSPAAINILKPDDSVQAAFVFGEQEEVELMWIKIRTRGDGNIEGTLLNTPVNAAAEVACGDTIVLEDSNIIACLYASEFE
ncbi:MAG: DUF2314 domain-containing protein [Woeseia sp.]